MSNTLVLHVTKDNYDAIVSGKKRVEYREYKSYWVKRLSFWYEDDRFPYYWVKIYCAYTGEYSVYCLDDIATCGFADLPILVRWFFLRLRSPARFFYCIYFSSNGGETNE